MFKASCTIGWHKYCAITGIRGVHLYVLNGIVIFLYDFNAKSRKMKGKIARKNFTIHDQSARISGPRLLKLFFFYHSSFCFWKSKFLHTYNKHPYKIGMQCILLFVIIMKTKILILFTLSLHLTPFVLFCFA